MLIGPEEEFALMESWISKGRESPEGFGGSKTVNPAFDKVRDDIVGGTDLPRAQQALPQRVLKSIVVDPEKNVFEQRLPWL